MNIDRCPSTLVPGFTSYSPAGLRKLFDGKKCLRFFLMTPPIFMESRKSFWKTASIFPSQGFRKNSLFLLTREQSV